MRQSKVNKMKIIGLTGGTGSGKGVVSAFLKNNGAYIVDADKIAHDIILKGKPAYAELVEYFGKEILGDDGEVVRRKLGTLVFSQGGEKLEFLNKCTHKYIFEEMKKEIADAEKLGFKAAVLDAPLLLEGNFASLCDTVWAVYTDEKIREERIMSRDGITLEQAKDRISKQKKWSEYEEKADVVLDNSKDAAYVESQALKALNKALGEQK